MVRTLSVTLTLVGTTMFSGCFTAASGLIYDRYRVNPVVREATSPSPEELFVRVERGGRDHIVVGNFDAAEPGDGVLPSVVSAELSDRETLPDGHRVAIVAPTDPARDDVPFTIHTHGQEVSNVRVSHGGVVHDLWYPEFPPPPIPWDRASTYVYFGVLPVCVALDIVTSPLQIIFFAGPWAGEIAP